MAGVAEVVPAPVDASPVSSRESGDRLARTSRYRWIGMDDWKSASGPGFTMLQCRSMSGESARRVDWIVE